MLGFNDIASPVQVIQYHRMGSNIVITDDPDNYKAQQDEVVVTYKQVEMALTLFNGCMNSYSGRIPSPIHFVKMLREFIGINLKDGKKITDYFIATAGEEFEDIKVEVSNHECYALMGVRTVSIPKKHLTVLDVIESAYREVRDDPEWKERMPENGDQFWFMLFGQQHRYELIESGWRMVAF